MDNTGRNALSIKTLIGYSHTVDVTGQNAVWESPIEFSENLVKLPLHLCTLIAAPHIRGSWHHRTLRGRDYAFAVAERTTTGRYSDGVVEAITGKAERVFWWRNSFSTRQEAENLAKHLNSYPDFQTLINTLREERYANARR